MKIRERQQHNGWAGLLWWHRVRQLREGESVPAGAESVPDETAEHGWRPENMPEEDKTPRERVV